MCKVLSYFCLYLCVIISHSFYATRTRAKFFKLNLYSSLDTLTDELTSNDASFLEIRSPDGIVSGNITAQLHNGMMSADDLNEGEFGSIFMQCAPYIAQHRGTTMVIHIPSKLLMKSHREIFDAVMDDISILHLLGIHLVLVAGVKDILDHRILSDTNMTITYHDSMRITDDMTMTLLKELSGSIRYEIESSLGRGFRGAATAKGVQVISGNSFYSAKPVGVRNGIDYKLTGEVRRIEVDNFKKRFDSGDIVLLTSLGHSNSGEVFNVPSELLAAETAAKLQASKLIFLTDGNYILDKRTLKRMQSLRLAQAISLLELLGLRLPTASSPVELDRSPEEIHDDSVFNTDVSPYSTSPTYIHNNQPYDLGNTAGSIIFKNDTLGTSNGNNGHTNGNNGHMNGNSTSNGYSRKDRVQASFSQKTKLNITADVVTFIHLIARCVHALSGGVRRAHLLPTVRGSLLKELFTRDGSGILISKDVYEGIRQATPADLREVEEIIRPLEKDGILVPRDRDRLERDIPNIYLLTRDGTTLALGMVKMYGEHHAEISCMAVRPAYRREGRGETILAYLERRALLMGSEYVFVLSTRTMQWFEERGYKVCDPTHLPPSRLYDSSRNSKVYMKKLGSQRDLDAEELLWNM